MTGEVQAAVAAAAVEAPAAPAPVKRPAAPEPTREDRIKAPLAGYEHGMNSNSPRHSAELAEIKALLAG